MEQYLKQSENILNWYNFNKEDEILELGGNTGELTQMLCKNVKYVTTIEPNSENIKKISEKCQKQKNLKIIEKFENLELDQQYDKIILIGIISKVKEIFNENISLKQIIQKVEKYLKHDGKIIIALDNKFGLRYFSGNPENILDKKFISLIGYNNEPEKIETFTKKSLEKTFYELGYNYNFYYPLPDYKKPDVIFTDKQLPKYNSIDKYNPYHTEKADIIINEIDVFREILKTDEDMFSFFANSFLVEITRGEPNKDYKYISFNNIRKEEYQLITKIADEFVEKQVVSEKANTHYQNIKNNIDILKENEIETVDYIEEDKIRSEYIEQKYLLNNVLTEKLEEGKKQEFNEIIDKYIKTISTNTYKETDYEKTVFGKYKIDIEDKSIIENLKFLKNGLWDMTFKNCFLVDNKLIFFDQEWNEENLPVEYILYRAILYTISLRRFISINDLFNEYGLSEYIELFGKLDNKLQEKIRDNKIWEFYSQNHYFDIDATKQEIINLNIRATSQDGAIKNLEKENNELKKRNTKLQETINNAFPYKLKTGFKKLLGGKNE